MHHALRKALSDDRIPPTDKQAVQTVQNHHCHLTATSCCQKIERLGHVQTPVNIFLQRTGAQVQKYNPP